MNISFKYIFSNFNAFYFFVIILCTARATIYTRGLMGYSGNIFAFLIPLILTFLFIIKNKIQFNRKGFCIVGGIYALWYFVQLLKFGGSNLALSFFFFYQLIIAYSIVYALGDKILFLFDAIVTKLSIISLAIWALNLLFPQIIDALIGAISLPIGESSLIKYNIFIASVLNAEVQRDVWFRNPGFSWEPGMNASILCTAIFINLIINKFKLKGNKNLLVLFIALVSSFSTTGYMTFICIILPFYLINMKKKWLIPSILLCLPFIVYLFQLDFMGEKIKNLQSDSESINNIERNIEWGDKQGDTFSYVPQRFDGLAFEAMNISNDPFIGYGLEQNNSYIYNFISDRIALTDGNLKILAQFGIIFGCILLFLYIYTCNYLAARWEYKGAVLLFLLFLFISTSYVFYNLPFYMGLMFFSFFTKNNTKYEKI